MQIRSRSISRILYSNLWDRSGDHSSSPSVAGWIERPTRRSYPDISGFGRAALLTPPYLVLHREEFAWPHVSPHAPVRSYFKPSRAAPFHPSPRVQISDLQSEILFELSREHSKLRGWSVLCCTCRHPKTSDLRTQIQEISELRSSNAPPLAGSLPCSVRTFLSWIRLKT